MNLNQLMQQQRDANAAALGSCSCPAGPGENCPLTIRQCRERWEQSLAAPPIAPNTERIAGVQP